MLSIQYIQENHKDIYEHLIGKECKVTYENKQLYEGKFTRSCLYGYDNYDKSKVIVGILVEDNCLLFTLGDNEYIDKLVSLGSYKQIQENSKLYNTAIYLSNFIPFVGLYEDIEYSPMNKVKMLLEAEEDEDGASMDGGDDSSEEGSSIDSEQEADSDASTEQPETNDNPDAALGQQGAKDDKEAKCRRDVKFTIWTDENKSTTSIKKGEKYLKIEYIYRNKKKDIVIDFLIGKDLNEHKWSLFAGKPGSTSYDDDPIKDLKAETLADAINNSIDEVLKVIDDVEGDPDNWVQFYIHH
jgi:hypothetical protein